jgi:hypothetical protein
MQSQRKPRTRALLAERVEAESPRTVFEGHVVEVVSADRVIFLTSGGMRVICLCPQHVDTDWVRAALTLGHVAAEASIPVDGPGTVWCLLPSPAQRKVVVDVLSLRAASRVEIACGKSKVELKNDGTVRVRGRNVLARGSRITRIQGGTVRLN